MTHHNDSYRNDLYKVVNIELAPVGNIDEKDKNQSAASREAKTKSERQKLYQTVFINGKQVRVKRPDTVEGIPVDEFMRENPDPLWQFEPELEEILGDER